MPRVSEWDSVVFCGAAARTGRARPSLLHNKKALASKKVVSEGIDETYRRLRPLFLKELL
jgi:hypothetical protein